LDEGDWTPTPDENDQDISHRENVFGNVDPIMSYPDTSTATGTHQQLSDICHTIGAYSVKYHYRISYRWQQPSVGADAPGGNYVIYQTPDPYGTYWCVVD
jgi:hypothetical protein